MNYNTYPTNTSSPEAIDEAAREQEYRKELAESIVAESVGTVGIYTSLDLDYPDKAHLKQVIANRNPEGNDNEITTGGGWGDWGERRLQRTMEERSLQNSPNEKLLQPHAQKREDREEVAFIEMPDDMVELRYYYMAQGYKDGTGRPGNALNVGFTLSQDKASELRRALEADPNYIDEIVKAQVLAVGMSEKHWDRYIKPRDSFRAPKEDMLAITHASVTGDVQTERSAYADKKTMLPAYEQPAATEELQPSPDALVDLNDAWQDSYEDTLRIIDLTMSHQREAGKSDDEIRASLMDVLTTARREMEEANANAQNDPEDATRSDAIYIAHLTALDEFDEQRAKVAQQAEMMQDQLNQVGAAQSEVAAALAPEVDHVFNLGDTVTIGGETKTVIDTYTMQNDAQTLMLVVRDSLGNEKHIPASSIK